MYRDEKGTLIVLQTRHVVKQYQRDIQGVLPDDISNQGHK
jgi:hypothetical protein